MRINKGAGKLSRLCIYFLNNFSFVYLNICHHCLDDAVSGYLAVHVDML